MQAATPIAPLTEDGPLDGRPVPAPQQRLLLICLLLNLADGFDVVAMSFAAPVISAAWSIRPETLGIVFSSALAGMTLGSLFLAPLSDVHGRRRVILIAAIGLSLAMLATAFATNVWQLGALRFLSGLGIGVLVPSTAAMATEFAPRSWRSAAVVMVAAGFSFGATGAGWIAGPVMDRFGWQGLFVCGGVLTGGLALAALFLLRESIDYLATLPIDAEARRVRINVVLTSLGRRPLDHLVERVQLAEGRQHVRALLGHALRPRTLLLWTLFFTYMWSSYLLSNWIPSLFVNAGFTRAQGIDALTWWTTGALIGALALGAASTRWQLPGLVSGMLFSAALLAIAWVTLDGISFTTQLVLVGLVGFMLSGIYGAYSIVTSAYPASVRATGLGWCIGLGRIGAIASPIVTGLLVGQSWALETLVLTLLVPPLLVSATLAWQTSRYRA